MYTDDGFMFILVWIFILGLVVMEVEFAGSFLYTGFAGLTCHSFWINSKKLFLVNQPFVFKNHSDLFDEAIQFRYFDCRNDEVYGGA